MIKHIVLWRLEEITGGRSRQEIIDTMKNALYGLSGHIPGLMKVEVGINRVGDGQESDISLITEFDTWESFHAYRNHPDHLPVKKLMQDYTIERRVIDYEI